MTIFLDFELVWVLFCEIHNYDIYLPFYVDLFITKEPFTFFIVINDFLLL